MCPACMTSAALILAGASATGGLAAFAARALGAGSGLRIRRAEHDAGGRPVMDPG